MERTLRMALRACGAAYQLWGERRRRGSGDARRLDLKTVTWRGPAPRWRRNPPIRPCDADATDRPPAGSGWLHEVKHDGFRILARKQGDRVNVWSHRGAEFTYRFQTIAEAVRGA
jgi:bifunctional non-homologous end joining protein LigD